MSGRKGFNMSRALPRLAAVALTLAWCAHFSASAAAAQELIAPASLATLTLSGTAAAPAPLFAVTQRDTFAAAAAPGAPDFSRIRRPSVLPALYALTAVTQALDAHSTFVALGRGAREANPLMQGAASHGGALLAVKAGAAIGTVFMAEKMWRRNRAGAIAAIVAMNVVTTVIAAHNYSVAARLR
jgi:hypothetical protein